MKYKIHSRINREQLILRRKYKRRQIQIKYISYIYIYIYIYTGFYWGIGGVPQPVKNSLIPPDQNSIPPPPPPKQQFSNLENSIFNCSQCSCSIFVLIS